ncbi:unnamed protein product [Mytilus edulis]|uniref:Peroxidase n=1 Tax=Mytilus edulis TaxID=6550 RepID=A0A8S3UYF9_MYTED|nr:unnamed protein product [Mytilus edulis]
MRSLKTTGGLTRGRGLSESQRLLWLLSMPQCSQMNEAMQKLTDVNYNTSEQHKELGKSRIDQDKKDVQIFKSFLGERNPFSSDINLRNIETGTLADEKVNVERSVDIGKEILKSMEDQYADDFVFKKNKQVVTLASKTNIKIDGEEVVVDPQLLFQRLVAAANNIFPDISEVFKFELSSTPAALFEPSGLMRQAQKATLGDALWNIGDCAVNRKLDSELHYVIDGGSLIQRLPWNKGSTFGEICQQYVDYIKRRYDHAVIVFDGYTSGPSTKDHVHMRRTKGVEGAKIIFKTTTPFRSKKENFLTNNENKQNFINMLSDALVKNDFQTEHADADADVLIAKTGVNQSISHPTVVIGEDTDVLVLLIFHCTLSSHGLFYRSDQSNRKLSSNKVWDIQKTKLLLGPEAECCMHVVNIIFTTFKFKFKWSISGLLSLRITNNSAFIQMNIRNSRNVLLLVLAEVFVFVHTQGPTYNSIEAAVSDATREVNAKRSGGLRQVQEATSGANSLEGITSHSAVHIPKCARYHSQRQAPELDKAISYAGDMAITATAKYAERNGGAFPDPTEFRKLMKPYCPNRATACNRHDLYRTANGSCNNLHNPSWGASLTTQARLMPPSYGDKFNLGLLPRMKSVTDCPLPSPRTISNALFNAGTSPPRSKVFNLALTFFGQFLDHDFISTPTLTGKYNYSKMVVNPRYVCC